MNSYIQIADSLNGHYSSGKIAQMQDQLPPQTVWAPEGSTPKTYLPDPGLFATILPETGEAAGRILTADSKNGFLIRAKTRFATGSNKKIIY